MSVNAEVTAKPSVIDTVRELIDGILSPQAFAAPYAESKDETLLARLKALDHVYLGTEGTIG